MSQRATLGDYLRARRRERGISIERAAEDTRIRADYLMRMESDEFDFLAPAYVRGFLRTYARFLGIDPAPLIEEIDRRFGGIRPEATPIAQLERRARREAPRLRRKTNRWAVAAVIAFLAIVGLAVVGIAFGGDDGDDRPPPVAATERSTTTTVASPTPVESPSPTPEATATALDLADGFELTVTAARGDCWVDIDADGQDVYTSPPSGIPVGGSAGPFDVQEQVEIVLGNAYAVDIVVDGVTLSPVGEEGEVKTIVLPDQIDELT